jgi:hypothetical protein
MVQDHVERAGANEKVATSSSLFAEERFGQLV